MAGTVVLAAACTERERLDGGSSADDDTGTGRLTEGITTSGYDPSPDPNGGNYPEPAVSHCGALPEGEAPIPGLRSAWAVQRPEGLRLQIGDWPMLCDGPQHPGDCISGWNFSMTLPPGAQAVGVYDLEAIEGLDFSGGYWVGDDFVCTTSAGGPSISGELEIVRVDPLCVVGVFRDLDAIALPVGGGGFQAMTCAG